MNLIKTVFRTALFLTVALAFTACEDDDNDSSPNAAVLLFENPDIEFSSTTNAWTNVFNPLADNDLVFGGFKFSHSGINEGYEAYTGFCPTKSTDKSDHAGDWVAHQWGAITGKGCIAPTLPYMIACWDSYNERDLTEMPENPSCSFRLTNGNKFSLMGFYITNTTWGYYAMKDGTNFNEPFEEDDYCFVRANFVRDGIVIGHKDVYLAHEGNFLAEWQPVEASEFGAIDMVYFTMESSDFSDFGMNNPAYFAFDALVIKVEK